MKVHVMQPIVGVDTVDISNPLSKGYTTFVRQDLVEQREADLLESLELSEDTVETLENLLERYAQEVIRLRNENTLLRSLRQMPPQSTPPAPTVQPWTWPPRPTDNTGYPPFHGCTDHLFVEY